MNNLQSRVTIQSALQHFVGKPLREASIGLLKVLGYQSDRTIPVVDSSPQAFLDLFANQISGSTFNSEKALLSDWRSATLLFQLTDQELSGETYLFKDDSVNSGLLRSYLFFAVELKGAEYARGKLSAIARQINRVFPMPVMVLIKHGDSLSIAVINRRASKLDADKDVLGKVTLIRDIDLANPHPGHLDILASFSVETLQSRKKLIGNFDQLHAAWEEVFNVELLNKRFYEELSNWYYWARKNVSFPADLEPNEEKRNSTSVIRLLTRLIFCWFLKEKGLIPDNLFDQHEVDGVLVSLDDEKSTYYHAILQNLFFATLNQEMNSKGKTPRQFAEDAGFPENRKQYGIKNLYRYKEAFREPAKALSQFEGIPFLNGGLFDCLDPEDEKGKVRYADGFSRNPKKRPSVPNYLFFAIPRCIDLSEDYSQPKRKPDTVRGLLHILRNYKFTIAENTPVEQEIALDPELLGKVFENLLASYNPETDATAQEQTGSFYTPRSIVDYIVDESLKAYLSRALNETLPANKANDATAKLDTLFAYTEREHEFSPQEVDVLIAAIDCCKILDPACGSGAFPMGILHKLVFILGRLDPKNEKWRDRQIAKAEEMTDIEARDSSVRAIERDFADNALDYGRKLYLIENCIYGIDIQPIAIQISKLRFFISLVCEQKATNDRAKNRGVRPLPNLETKFVTADALIALRKAQIDLFANPKVVQIEKEIETVRHRHFSAQTRQQKLALQQRDRDLRAKLFVELNQLSFADEDASRKIASWNPYDHYATADFFDPTWMFNRSLAAGFDVVIGNPPYRSVEEFAGTPLQEQWKRIFKTYSARGDIYCFFYERGADLLRANGTLCYITSNKWMRTGYGEKLRNFLATEVDTTFLLDFGMAQNFGAATTYTCVTSFTKRPSRHVTRCCYALDDRAAMADPAGYFKSNATKLQDLSGDTWVVLPPDRQEIKLRVSDQGLPLEKWDIKINYGIKTGYNDAFYLTLEERQGLIKKDPHSAELIVKLLRGRNIRRYTTRWDHDYQLIVKFGSHEYLEERYPAVYEHLLKYKRELQSRGQCRGGRKPEGTGGERTYPGQHHWLELDNNPSDDYLNAFLTPKIVYPNMTNHLPFYFDRTEHFFVNDKAFIISSTGDSLSYLTAVLNSAVFRCCFKDNFPELLGNTYEIRKIFVDKIPIKKPAESQISLFDKLVTLIQRAKSFNDGIATFLEEVIEACVMEVYFVEYMAARNLSVIEHVANLLEGFGASFSDSRQNEFLDHFYQTANSSKHPIRNRLIRIPLDSPELLAVIQKEGRL